MTAPADDQSRPGVGTAVPRKDTAAVRLVDRPLDGEGLEGVEAVGMVGALSEATAAAWRSLLLAREWTADVVVLDLEQVSFLDSSGLSVLVSLHRRLETEGRRLAVAGPEPTSRLLTLTGLDQLIPVLTSLDDAARLPPLEA